MISNLVVMFNFRPIITSIIFLLISTSFINAQNLDSIQFVNKQWTQTNLAKGIVWKKAIFTDFFDSNQIINIIEIDLNKKNLKRLGIEALEKSRKKTSQLADSLNAIAAINGGFFDMKNGGAVDYIKVNNQVFNSTHAKGGRADAYLALDGKKILITKDSTQTLPYSDVMLSGPFLVDQKQVLSLPKNAFNDNRHPRTAIGISKNKLILLTVDGRHKNAQGMNLNELAQIFKWSGCDKAMNLDGGGSTTMYISTQPNNGVVNYPSDNKQLDHEGERRVSNIIYIK